MPPKKNYLVWFDYNLLENVHANAVDEAVILAQAKQIEKCNKWRNVTRVQVDTGFNEWEDVELDE